jgi:hypothetical protein
MPFIEDLDAYFDLDAVSVTANGVSGKGYLDIDSQLVLDDQQVTVPGMLTVRTDLFGSLKINDLVIIGTQQWRAQYDPQRFDDGSFCMVPLSGPVAIPSAFTTGYLTTTRGVRIVTARGTNLTTARGFPNG